MRRSGAALGFAVTGTLVTAFAPAVVAAVVLFVPLACLVAWAGWASLSREAPATDDRADLVVRPVRSLPRPSATRLPPFPQVPRPRHIPADYALPPLAHEVPGTIQGWLRRRPEQKGLDR